MLEGMIKTNLNIIEAKSDSMLDTIKKADYGFKNHGEVYFRMDVKK